MAKRDKDLYRRLRTHGVRKRAARTAAEADASPEALRAIAQELGEAADALEARVAGSPDGADPDGELREAARRTAAKQV